MSRRFKTALVLALLPALPAWAADATPDGARQLEADIRAWIGSLTGPAIPLPDRVVQVAPEGDHYRLAVPVGIEQPGGGGVATVTANARMLDGTRWAVDSIRWPTPATFTVQLPQPPKPGEPATGPVTIPVTYTINVEAQNNQITFDPTYATPSTTTSSYQGLSIQTQSSAVQQTTRVDRSASTATLRPAGGDRVDVSMDGTAEGYAITSRAPDTQEIKVNIGQVRVLGAFNGVSRQRSTQFVQSAVRLLVAVGARSTQAAQGSAPPVDPALARALFASLRDFASSFTLEETFDRLQVSYGGVGGTASQARIGMGAESRNGLLQARLDLGVDGLALPGLGLGPMEALLPRRIALRPVVSNVAVDDLMRLIENSDQGRPPSPEDINRLFSRGGINTGLESFTVEVGSTTLTGMAGVVVAGPRADQVTVQAQVTATNLDALIQQVSAFPQFQQAGPVFLFAKGIGRTVDNRVVWDISWKDGKLLINNVDVMQMMGGGPNRGGPPPRR